MRDDRTFRAAVVQWDVANWWRSIEFWESRLPADLAGTRSLEVGCERGGLSLWLALKHSQVVCSNCIDPRPLAQEFHRSWGVDDRIQYETLDATSLPYENEFDFIALKSVLGSIGEFGNLPAVETALHGMYRALKPGGRLLFAENLDTRFHRFFRRMFVPWGKTYLYFDRPFVSRALSHFKDVELMSCGVLGCFGRSPAQRSFLGALDERFLSDLVPPQFHYIAYGIAQK